MHRRLSLGASLTRLLGRSPNVLLQFNSGNLSHKFVTLRRNRVGVTRKEDHLGGRQAFKWQARIAIRPLPSSEREVEPENVDVVREIRQHIDDQRQWLPPSGLFFGLVVGDTGATSSY
jgi:hypothetical protein